MRIKEGESCRKENEAGTREDRQYICLRNSLTDCLTSDQFFAFEWFSVSITDSSILIPEKKSSYTEVEI